MLISIAPPCSSLLMASCSVDERARQTQRVEVKVVFPSAAIAVEAEEEESIVGHASAHVTSFLFMWI
jgi:hypothetical protein